MTKLFLLERYNFLQVQIYHILNSLVHVPTRFQLLMFSPFMSHNETKIREIQSYQIPSLDSRLIGTFDKIVIVQTSIIENYKANFFVTSVPNTLK